MSLRPAALIVAGLTAFTVACRPRSEGPAQGALIVIEQPDLGRLEPGVAARLREAAAFLDTEEGSAELGQAYGALGQLYHAYELLDPARDCYLNATTLLPGEHRWHYYLGHVQRSLDEIESAQGAFAQALSMSATDVPTLIALAGVRRDLGNLDSARELASRALEIDGASAAAHLLLAQLASARLDHAAAVRHYEAILGAQPSATRLYQPLAMAYRSLGETDRARELLGHRGDGPVAVSDPLLTEIQRLRLGGRSDLAEGVAAFERGDVRGAALAFERAVEALPGDAAARLNLGSALWKMGDAQGALAQYRAAIELDPDNALAHYNLGTLQARLGDDDAAASSFGEAIRIREDYPAARFNLANALRRQGRCDVALSHYARVVAQDLGNRAPRLGEIACLSAVGRFAEARDRAEAGLAALPDDLVLLDALARLLSASPEAGVRDGKLASELSRHLVDAQRTVRHLEARAMALAETGEWGEAAAVQRQALSGAEPGSAVKARLQGNLARYEESLPCRDPAILDEQ